MNPRAITGLGIASPLGIGREPFFQAMQAPKLLADSPPFAVETFDGTKYAGADVAEVRGLASRMCAVSGTRWPCGSFL